MMSDRWNAVVRAPPVVFAAVLSASLLVRCGGKVTANSTHGVSESPEAGTVATGARGGSFLGVGGSASATGGRPSRPIGAPMGMGGVMGPIFVPVPPPPPVKPPPPVMPPSAPVHCVPGAPAESCPIPPPFCEDGVTLSYFTDPACPMSTCEWTRRTIRCEFCQDGGCRINSGPSPSPVPLCWEGDGGTCPFQPSICLNDSQMVYFENPRCVTGICESTGHVTDCSGMGCRNGVCVYMSTH